jgi:hypothetical protein
MRRICSKFPTLTALLRPGIALLSACLWTATPAVAQAQVGVSTTVSSARYDESHTWSITKTGNSKSGFAGDVLPGGQWVINVQETSAPTNFFVSGVITVSNPSSAAIVAHVSGATTDGVPASVDCNGGGSAVTLAAGTSQQCSYILVPTGAAPAFTAAAAVVGGSTATASIPINYVVNNVIGGTATLTDWVMGSLVINETLVAGQGPWSRTVTDPQGFSCSVFRSEYGANHDLYENRDNDAVLTVGEDRHGASASISYRCRAAFADVLKTTQGVVNTNLIWTFPFFNGPNGFSDNYANLVGGVQTDIDPDADGLLPLVRALNPNRTYTVCEANLPAGWKSTWKINGQSVTPYNPDFDPEEAEVEDVGNRCVEIGAGTASPLVAGQTVSVTVDNHKPGTPQGQPRSPRYWTKWNRCTVSNRDDKADENAVRAGLPPGQGWRVGFWLLEDVLNPLVGGGIRWDDIQSDTLQVPIETCEEAVEILEWRQVKVNGKVGDGRIFLLDSARKLARQLLAAQLNVGARACTTPAVLQAITQAETLLDGINFDGTRATIYPLSGAQILQTLALRNTLAKYNWGFYCGATP